MSYPLNSNWGCIECSYDKLRNWAIHRGIISELDGPEEMANRIMRLPDRMQTRITYLQEQLDAPRDKCLP